MGDVSKTNDLISELRNLSDRTCIKINILTKPCIGECLGCGFDALAAVAESVVADYEDGVPPVLTSTTCVPCEADRINGD